MLHRKLVHEDERLERHYGIPQHYGLFYAMGLALIMEGIMSACYHVCPNYSNFQFGQWPRFTQLAYTAHNIQLARGRGNHSV